MVFILSDDLRGKRKAVKQQAVTIRRIVIVAINIIMIITLVQRNSYPES